MSENKDEGVVVVRRRRKIIRHQREKTPEPTIKSGIKPKYSDDESSSAAERYVDTVTLKIPSLTMAKTLTKASSPPATPVAKGSSHRSKILSRRDKAVGTSAVRSSSTPRDENKSASPPLVSILRQPKRSLSSPRQKDQESSDLTSSPSQFEQDEKPAQYSPTNKKLASSENDHHHGELSKLELNLRRFEDERRRFEIEKQKFEKEKCEMNKIRYKRLEDFERKRQSRKTLDEQSNKLKDSDNSIEPSVKNPSDEHEKLYKVLGALDKPVTDPLPAVVTNEAAKIVKGILVTKPQSTISEPQEIKPNLNEILPMAKPAIPIETPNKIFRRIRRTTDISDDYESSTALSSSSRDGDFDEIDDSFFDQPIEVINKPLQHINLKASQTIKVEPIAIESTQSKPSWWRRWYRRTASIESNKNQKIPPIKPRYVNRNRNEKISLYRLFFIESRQVWQELLDDYADEWEQTKIVRNRCISNLIILTIFCGFGGMIFRFVEGAFESFYKCGVRRVKRDFVDNLWLSSHNLREDDWKTMARNKLRKFEEELHAAHDAGMTSYSGMKSWSFVNGIIYCMTIVTTIGYGHISPSTNTGRAITIVYAIIGIPIFLILLADFGKLFTRGIKFLWAYIRRLYYTGSCRRVRKQAQVQEVLRGMEMAYEIATFRRPSTIAKEDDIEQPTTNDDKANQQHLSPPENQQRNADSPTTPIPPDLDEPSIDDEFNLPISLALFILLAYIFMGASVYSIWEDWSFFESCYFVFISMSTIGFGDFVPKHPIYMMTSIIYLVFGLALTSMCINVVQVKLSDSFRQASAKIGATIGLTMAEEEARNSQNQTPAAIEGNEIPTVHTTGIKSSTSDETVNVSDVRLDDKPPPLMPKKSNLPVAEEKDSKSKKDASKKKSKK